MGYTNYWDINLSKKEFSPSIINKVKKILSTYEKIYSESIVKGFFNLDEKPTVSKDFIHFNSNSDKTGEDFFFSFNGYLDSFCKTGRENYDAAVKAVLMVMKSEGYITNWSFDGRVEDNEYDAGIKLLAKAGIKYNERMKAED